MALLGETTCLRSQVALSTVRSKLLTRTVTEKYIHVLDFDILTNRQMSPPYLTCTINDSLLLVKF